MKILTKPKECCVSHLKLEFVEQMPHVIHKGDGWAHVRALREGAFGLKHPDGHISRHAVPLPLSESPLRLQKPSRHHVKSICQ